MSWSIDRSYPIGYYSMYTILRSDEFDRWLNRLKDVRGKARIAARILAVEYGNLGDWEPVGEGVSEMMIHFGPDTASTSRDAASSFSCCCSAATRAARSVTSSAQRR